MKIKREVKIGVFAVIILAGTYWGLNFLKGKEIFTRDNTYFAIYDQIPDLSKAAPVFIRGVRVGLVNDITYDPRLSDDIVVSFSVRNKFKLPKDSKAVLFSNGFLAGKAIRVDMGTSEEVLMSGDTMRSAKALDIMDIAAEQIDYLKDVLATLTNNINTTLTTLNIVMTDNADHLAGTMGNIRNITGNLDRMLIDQRTNLNSTLENVNHLTTTLRDNSGNIHNIIRNVDNFTDSLNRAGLPQTIAKLDEAAGRINSTLADINNGKGTIGLLVNERTLYDSLNMAVSNLSELIADIQANPKRYVKVSVF